MKPEEAIKTREAIRLVVAEYFEQNLFLADDQEMRTATDLVDDLVNAVMKVGVESV